ncbi:hypothetical protein K505DRAFT_331925 [Melanomma pulvis-pyrius CBS 109.77]|uniref:Uncharacterized protein n=1 Tax=Melanomma pulvis-pyrius CBS 109.77 TaxID=1314802 RepID=A0A6A6XUI8_9PLEO|nr:hypothetical protein K505DRAFT_331925 [Melanomma pulvis-pyrius CBS 109.77]
MSNTLHPGAFYHSYFPSEQPRSPIPKRYRSKMNRGNPARSPSDINAIPGLDPVLDVLQDRMYNWLNGPTTLNDGEVNSLVNNITFLVRRLQLSSGVSTTNILTSSSAAPSSSTAPASTTPTSSPNAPSVISDTEVFIVTGGKDDGYIMSVFLGPRPYIIGEWRPKRSEAMEGLRARVETFVWRIIKRGVPGEAAIKQGEGKGTLVQGDGDAENQSVGEKGGDE